jgi:phenylalanyl-tRNA synthetase alpha subunit
MMFRRARNYIKYGIARRNPGNYSINTGTVEGAKASINRASAAFENARIKYMEAAEALRKAKKHARLLPYIQRRYQKTHRGKLSAEQIYRALRNTNKALNQVANKTNQAVQHVNNGMKNIVLPSGREEALRRFKVNNMTRRRVNMARGLNTTSK